MSHEYTPAPRTDASGVPWCSGHACPAWMQCPGAQDEVCPPVVRQLALKVTDLMQAGRELRTAQKEFFRLREPALVGKCKVLEKKLDALLWPPADTEPQPEQMEM